MCFAKIRISKISEKVFCICFPKIRCYKCVKVALNALKNISEYAILEREVDMKEIKV